jgi:hypothetical protein
MCLSGAIVSRTGRILVNNLANSCIIYYKSVSFLQILFDENNNEGKRLFVGINNNLLI